MQQSIVFIYNIYNVSFKKYGILKNIFSNQNTSKSSLIYDIFQNMELHKVLRHIEHIRTGILYVFLFSSIQHSVETHFVFFQWQGHRRENVSLPNKKDFHTRMACHLCEYFQCQNHIFQLFDLSGFFET